MPTTPLLFQLLEDDEPAWSEIRSLLLRPSSSSSSSSSPDARLAANYTDPETKLTCLHLAVMAKGTKQNLDDRIAVIRSLLQSYLTATTIQCEEYGYTPLMYACICTRLEDMPMDLEIVKLLLKYNPKSVSIKTTLFGHRSALDVHIMSMSYLLQNTHTNFYGSHDGNCMLILNLLLALDMGVLLPKSLELLFACNAVKVLELMSFHQQEAARRKIGFNVPSGFWVWQFCLAMLRSEHKHTYHGVEPAPPFRALHTACQIPDFPLAFLVLLTSLEKKDAPSNLAWHASTRKSMALACLGNMIDVASDGHYCNGDGRVE